MNNWSKVIKTTVPQYALSSYGNVSVLYNAEEEQELIVAGYASPQVVDREKHLITKKALAADLERFLAHPHYRNAMLLHSNVQVGEVLPKWCNPETGECWETKVDDIGLFAIIKVRTDAYRPTIVDKVIQDIREGKIASFSISADAPFESRRYECVDGTCFWIIDAIEYYEITLCETPVNQDANFTILSKSLEKEFKASAFCQDGSCPITTFSPISAADRARYWIRKAKLTLTKDTSGERIAKAPLGGGLRIGGQRGNGVADPVEPIPAAKAPEPIDPRKPDMADGTHGGGKAGAGRDAVAKGTRYEAEVDLSFPVSTNDLSYADGIDTDDDSTTYANRSQDGEEYYLNKSGYYVFDALYEILEKAIDENVSPVSGRLALAALQRGDTLRSISYINKGWVVWSDAFPSAIQKDFITLSDVLDSIVERSSGSLLNDTLVVKSLLAKRMPLRGLAATEAFNDVVFRLVSYANPLDKCGLELNGEAIASHTEKGYGIGWVSNAQRALNNAVEALRLHIVNNEESRLALSPDILAALDVLYEDMQAVADNLGMGRELEKYKVQGDHPQLDIIAEVANSTVQDVQNADILLEKVDYDFEELNDPEQAFFPEQGAVVTGNFQKAELEKENPNHEPAGSPEGGQFAEGHGSGGGVAAPAAKPAHEEPLTAAGRKLSDTIRETNGRGELTNPIALAAREATLNLSPAATKSLFDFLTVGTHNPQLDADFANNTPVGQEITQAFEPVRQALKQQFGDTVRLYRSQETPEELEREGKTGERKGFLSFADEKFARSLADRGHFYAVDVPVDSIRAMPTLQGGDFKYGRWPNNYTEFMVDPKVLDGAQPTGMGARDFEWYSRDFDPDAKKSLEKAELENAKRYIHDPNEAPPGANVQHGPRGGAFWDTDDPHLNPNDDDEMAPVNEHLTDGMLAWFLPPELASKLALQGGEAPEELHLTFAYFPDITQVNPEQMVAEVTEFARHWQSFDGTLGGVGRFSGDGKDVCYISVDASKLPLFRTQLLDSISIQEDQTHGYVPHVTLMYVAEDQPNPINRIPAIPITIDSISVVLGGKRKDIPLSKNQDNSTMSGNQDIQKAIQNKNGAVGFANVDVWAPKKRTEFSVNPLVGDAEKDTVASGTHNPVEVVHKPVETRPEFDQRGALKAGDEDAKQLALGLARIFNRTVNDGRYRLAIVKDEDGNQRTIELGY